MKKPIIIIVILVIIVIAGFALFRQPGETTSQSKTSGEGTASDREVKEIEIKASNWKFTPELIEVNLGDKVELHLESTEGTHGFIIPAFGISERLEPGKDVHAEFVADKAGTFNFYCNVPCGAGHSNMNGIIVVK